MSTAEDSAYTLGLADFGFGDADDTPANAFVAVRISTLPGAGTVDVGYIGSIGFFAGATQVANYNDGTAFLGHKNVGAGEVFGINLHLITSDTAFQVADTPWATQIVVNAIGGTGAAVPEPASWALMIGGFGMAGAALRRRRAVAVAA